MLERALAACACGLTSEDVEAHFAQIGKDQTARAANSEISPPPPRTEVAKTISACHHKGICPIKQQYRYRPDPEN